MDKLSAQQRHNNMAAIRSKDTKPEMIVRRGLWKRGSCYRLNAWASRLGTQKSVAFWARYIKITQKTTISYFVHDMRHE